MEKEKGRWKEGDTRARMREGRVGKNARFEFSEFNIFIY